MDDLEHKKIILERIVKCYEAEGPLPSVSDLKFYLSMIDPQELAQAMYFLKYQEYKKSFSESYLYLPPHLMDRIYISEKIKQNLEKILVAVACHFRKTPQESSKIVDDLFHRFYKALVHLATEEGLMSYN